MSTIPFEALQALDARFGCDSLIALATVKDGMPSVRAVNAYYEKCAFYVITNLKSNKMRELSQNPAVAICGDWFTAHGVGESLGWMCAPKNADIADKLRAVFAEWLGNGHVNEADTNTIILRIRLTDGVLFDHGTRYDLKF